MSAYHIATRYSKSLLDLAAEQGKMPEVLEDMKAISANIAENRELYLMLKSPIIASDKKWAIMNKIYTGHASDLTLSFLHIIIRKRREEYVPEIAQSFIDLYNEMHKITTAQLITAVPVDEKTLSQAAEIVKKETGAAEVQIIASINEGLIGGFVLQFNDKLVDVSISRQLSLLKKQFSTN